MELNLERSTWQLLHALYSDRVTEGQEEEMVTELLVCGELSVSLCVCVCM